MAKSVDIPHLRSVVLAGHAGAGKTTLAEQLLYAGGAIGRLGRVDDGTASLDFEPEEQKRHESLSLAVASLDHADHRITIVDTPGYADFFAEVVEGAAAADAAILVMDASGGIEAGLEAAVRLARASDLPALFVVNKADREGAAQTAAILRQMLRLGPRRPWEPPVLLTTATTGQGVEAVVAALDQHRAHLLRSGEWSRVEERRAASTIRRLAQRRLWRRLEAALPPDRWTTLVQAVAARQTDPHHAADELLRALGLPPEEPPPD